MAPASRSKKPMRKVKIAGKPVKFELVGEDDQADPKTATTVAQRLMDAGVWRSRWPPELGYDHPRLAGSTTRPACR